MTLHVSQDDMIEIALMKAIEKNPDKDKSEIITIVVEELDVPRPTVRRVKRQLLVKLAKYVELLS